MMHKHLLLVIENGTSKMELNTFSVVHQTHYLSYQRRNIGNHHRFYGNINVDYKFHFYQELRLIVNAGIDKQKGDGKTEISSFARAGYWNGLPVGNAETNYDNFNKNINTQLNYTKNFGKLSFDLLGGYEYQNFDYENYNCCQSIIICTRS